MKTLQFLFISLCAFLVKAQNPIIDIVGKGGIRQTNAYYKDVNNLLDPYQGTYIYTNGTTSFTIVLVKKVQQYNGRYYEDLIIGEYRYIENGVEQINTLDEIDTVYNNQRFHNIESNWLIDNDYIEWPCITCATNEKRLNATIYDASTDRYGDLIIRKMSNANGEYLEVSIGRIEGVAYDINGPLPPDFSLPKGNFILIKQ